jgi:rubrerythrin
MIPLGFVINSVFYATVIAAAIVGLRISARETRSLIRARRGECRACGHPLAGLPRCPECGAEVPRPARA